MEIYSDNKDHKQKNDHKKGTDYTGFAVPSKV